MACHLSTGTGFGAGIVQPDVTDARGWGDDDNAQTFRFADLDGDGDRDMCARANAGMLCWPFEAGAFGTRWSGPELSNAAGWDVANTFGTLRLVDVDGDRRADLVGRGPEGVDTWPGAGAGFGTVRNGARLADASAWWKEHYASTFRLAEPPRRPEPAVDSGLHGGAGDTAASGGGETGGGVTVDSGTPGATDEDLDAVPGAKRQVASGCMTSPGATPPVGALAAVLLAAGALRARRRR
jgi:MYXO-CTERM domain-containing protein